MKKGTETASAATRNRFSTRTLRNVVLPLASFYARSQRPSHQGEPPPTLNDDERKVLEEAASKLVAESEGLLRALRVGADPQDAKVIRNPETGLFPEPSLVLVGEVLAAAGMVPSAPQKSAAELEIAKLELELERERLALERQRMALIQHQVMRGGRVTDPGPVPVWNRGEPRALELVEPGIPSGARTKKSAFTLIDRKTSLEQIEVEGQLDPSSMEKQGIRDQILDCLRVALCDLILCFLDLVCVDGKFDFSFFDDQNEDPEAYEERQQQLMDCLGVFICTALRCIVDVLCPPEQPSCMPAQHPCDLAVEEL